MIGPDSPLAPHYDAVITPLRRFLLLTAVSVAAVGAAWLTASGDVDVLAMVAILAALLVLAGRAPGPLAALLVLAVLNGVPIINLSGRVPGGVPAQDAAAIVLAALLYAYRAPSETVSHARLVRTATIWSGWFIAFWVFTVARSVLVDQIPVLKAVLFGRDFLYFAVLLPLAVQARLPSRSLRAGAWTLLAGVTVYAIGDIVISLTSHTLPWLVHPTSINSSLGTTTRVYSSMYYLVNTCLIFTVALLLSARSRGNRLVLGAFVILLAVTASLQLGRANYFGLAVALIAGITVYVIRYASIATTFVRGAVAVLLVATVGVALAGSGASAAPIVGTVISRVSTGVSDLSHATGNVGYRETVDNEMLHVLGSNWPVGLGFLDPAAHYVPSLPSGTIRNIDTGFFNILMTMGLVGALLIYAPLMYALRELVRASRRTLRSSPQFPRWIFYGGAAWIAWAVASSPTLALLFTVPGVVVAAVTLGMLAYVLTDQDLFSR